MTPEETKVLEKLWFIVDALAQAREDLDEIVIDKDASIQERHWVGGRGKEHSTRITQHMLLTRITNAVIGAEVGLRGYLKPSDGFWPEVVNGKHAEAERSA